MSLLERLSDDEADLYLTLISLGQLTIGELAFIKKKNENKIAESIKNLLSKGFVKEVPGQVPKLIAQYPFQHIMGTSEDVITQLTTVIADLEKFVSTKSANVTEQMKQSNTTISAQLTKGQEALAAENKTTIATIKTKLAEAKKNTNAMAEEVNTVAAQVIETTITKSITKINELNATSVKGLDNSIETSRGTIKEELTAVHKTIDTVLEEKAKNNQETLTTLTEAIQTIQGSLNQQEIAIQTHFDSLQKNLTQLLKNTDTTVTSEITNALGKSHSELTNSATKVKNTVNTQLDILKAAQQKTLGQISQESQIKYRNSLNDYQGELKKQSDTLMAGITTQVDQLSNDLTAEMVKYRQQFTVFMMQTQQKITQLLDTIKSSTTQTVGSIGDRLTTATKDIDNNITQTIDNKVKTTLEAVVQSIEVTKMQTATEMERITTDYKKYQDSVIQTTAQKLKSSIDREITQNTQFITTSSTQFSKTVQDAEQVLKSNQKNFQAILGNDMQNIDKLLKNANSNIANLGKKITQLQIDTITNLKQQLTTLNKQLVTELEKVKTQTVDSISAKVGTIIQKMVSVLASLENDSSSAIGKAIATATQQLSDTKTLITKEVENEIHVMTDSVNNYTKEFQNTAKEIQSQVERVQTSINEVAEKVAKIPPLQQDTIPIIGQKAILSYINEMYNHTKASITFIIPKLTLLPVEEIKQSKGSKRITLIISTAEAQSNEELLRRFAAKENIRIRTMDAKELAMNYIVADRDGEEFCIGMTSEKDETIVGLATMNDAYVELFGKIILGTYFLAASKEISKTQYGY